MPEFDVAFYLVAIPAVVFLGISKGGFGSAADFVSMAILALILPPGQALGLLLPLLLVMDLASLRAYWRKWDAKIARILLVGAVPGVALGAVVYRVVDDDVVRVLIGAIAVLFVAWRLGLDLGWIRQPRRAMPDRVGHLAGLLAGFGSCVSHAGGPASISYQMSLHMEKTAFQATSVLLYWVVNILKLMAYTWLGLFSADLMFADVVLFPFALLGIWLGVRAHHLVPQHVFFGLTYVLLLGAGGRLLWEGLT